MAYATLQDVIDIYRPLNADEIGRVNTLLPLVSDLIDQEAIKLGKDIQEMLDSGKLLNNVLKLVCVDVIRRVLSQTDESTQMSQGSISALGYSQSYTYAVPGGGIYLLENEKRD